VSLGDFLLHPQPHEEIFFYLQSLNKVVLLTWILIYTVFGIDELGKREIGAREIQENIGFSSV
jgi:hypothetical protein